MNWNLINQKYVELSKNWASNVTELSLKQTPDPLGGHFLDFSDKEKVSLAFMERGEITSRKVATSVDELMYLIFKGEAKARALDYEVKNRIPNQDFRRIYFSKAVEELSKISKIWGERLLKEFNSVLEENPFLDELAERYLPQA